MKLFGRVAELHLYRPRGTGFSFFLPNAVIIKDLRFTFDIEKTLSRHPNKATIRIYNASRGLRLEMSQRPLHVRLYAGYEDGGPELLYRGDVIHGYSNQPDEVTWQTILSCGDGSRAVKYARISQTFKSDAPALTILNSLASTLGMRIPSSKAGAEEFIKQYSTGITLQGPSAAQLAVVLRRFNMSYSIQDGQLQVLRQDESNEATAAVVSVETGMVGSPEYGPPVRKGRPPSLKVRHKLRPGLRPGGRMSLKSKHISGVIRMLKVRYVGDTHQIKTWHTTIEAAA